MRKILSGLALLSVLFIVSTSAQAHHDDMPNLAAIVGGATYIVRGEIAATPNRPAATAQGTAFHIGGGYLVTAGHVIDGVSNLALDSKRQRGGVYPVEVVTYRLEPGFGVADWAILYVAYLEGRTKLELECTAPPKRLAEMVEYGAPSGYPLFARGFIQAVSANLLYYTPYPPIGPGASGSAVVNPKTGRVMAIHIEGSRPAGIPVMRAWIVRNVPELCGDNAIDTRRRP